MIFDDLILNYRERLKNSQNPVDYNKHKVQQEIEVLRQGGKIEIEEIAEPTQEELHDLRESFKKLGALRTYKTQREKARA